ncbi:hypothetical protein FRC01_008608 [Tulasnella sp. 417]|nr:hypothetical protein FRC01_008608 [Tulasnella sp. 417]
MAEEPPSTQASSRYSENPFNLLPRELVSKVFFEVARGSRVPMERYRLPGRLAPTCRRFRDIVYDSPELWTTLVIRYGVNARHLPGYLARSCGQPLHIDLHVLQAPGHDLSELAAPVLAQSHRWESLSARTFAPLVKYSLLGTVLPNLTLPQLSRLSLSYSPPQGRRWVDGIIPQYSNLRVLEISDFYLGPQDIPYTTLQELDLRTMDWDRRKWKRLLLFLNSNRALQRLRLVITVPYGYSNLTGTQIELPSLTSLTLEYSHNFPITQLLDNIQAPHLAEICLRPEAPILARRKWITMDKLLDTCLDRFGALNQIVLSGLPLGPTNAVRQDCRRRRMKLSETGSSGVDVTVRIDHEEWKLKDRRS